MQKDSHKASINVCNLKSKIIQQKTLYTCCCKFTSNTLMKDLISHKSPNSTGLMSKQPMEVMLLQINCQWHSSASSATQCFIPLKHCLTVSQGHRNFAKSVQNSTGNFLKCTSQLTSAEFERDRQRSLEILLKCQERGSDLMRAHFQKLLIFLSI